MSGVRKQRNRGYVVLNVLALASNFSRANALIKEGEPAPPAVTSSTKAGSAGGGISHNSSAPVSFSSRSLKGSRDKGELLLTGDVVLVQDDTEVRAKRARLVGRTGGASTPQSKAPKNQKEKRPSSAFEPHVAYLYGSVTLLKKGTGPHPQTITAKAHEVEYNIQKRTVVLKGRPEAIVTKGVEKVQGKTIVLALDTGDIEVVGAHGVVLPSAHEPPPKPQK